MTVGGQGPTPLFFLILICQFSIWTFDMIFPQIHCYICCFFLIQKKHIATFIIDLCWIFLMFYPLLESFKFKSKLELCTDQSWNQFFIALVMISCHKSMNRCCWNQEPRRPGNNNDNDSGCWKRCSHNNYNSGTWERGGNSCGRWTYRVGNKTILKFCFSSGAAAATNQTDVSFRSNKICITFGFCKVLIIQVGSNATDTGAAPTPAPTTTSTTTTTTTTEKPLEPCQCLGDPSLLNNTENAK